MLGNSKINDAFGPGYAPVSISRYDNIYESFIQLEHSINALENTLNDLLGHCGDPKLGTEPIGIKCLIDFLDGIPSHLAKQRDRIIEIRNTINDRFV